MVRQAQEMRRQVAFGGGAVVEEEGEGEGDKLHQKVKQVGVWVSVWVGVIGHPDLFDVRY